MVVVHVPKHLYGWASIHKWQKEGESFSVEGIALDDICDREMIGLLKIDAEGSELRVLRGASRTLRVTERVVVEASGSKGEVSGFLRKRGFQTHVMYFTSHLFAYRGRPEHLVYSRESVQDLREHNPKSGNQANIQ